MMSIDNRKLIRRRRISSSGPDHTLYLSDDCLAFIFHSLSYVDRQRCSLVCRRWLRIDAQSRHRLCLFARSDLLPYIPSIFARFDSVTELALKWDDRSITPTTIGDLALILISVKCKNLTRLMLDTCQQITADGVEAFSKNCARLKMFSYRYCAFGARGLNAILDNCTGLEELYAKHSRITAPITAASSLKVIYLMKVDNVQFFAPLVGASKSLRTLKLARCRGQSDTLLQSISEIRNEMREVHLVDVNVGDVEVSAITSFCPNLEFLRLWSTYRVTGCPCAGTVTVVKRCNQIGGGVLMEAAENCADLQELELKRVAVVDAELACIAGNCNSLKRLRIEKCPVSDECLQALAYGFPDLAEVTLMGCYRVTSKGVDWLRATRPSLTVQHERINLRRPIQQFNL